MQADQAHWDRVFNTPGMPYISVGISSGFESWTATRPNESALPLEAKASRLAQCNNQ